MVREVTFIITWLWAPRSIALATHPRLTLKLPCFNVRTRACTECYTPCAILTSHASSSSPSRRLAFRSVYLCVRVCVCVLHFSSVYMSALVCVCVCVCERCTHTCGSQVDPVSGGECMPVQYHWHLGPDQWQLYIQSVQAEHTRTRVCAHTHTHTCARTHTHAHTCWHRQRTPSFPRSFGP